MTSFAAVLTKVGNGWATLRVIRGPLLVSIFAALVLSLPDQSREVYRIMADEWAASWSKSEWLAAPVLRVGLTFLFLIIASFGVWVSTTDIALRGERWGSPAQDSSVKQFLLRPLVFLPALLFPIDSSSKRILLRLLLLLPALLIPIGLAIGLYAASADLQALQFPNEVLKKVNDPRLDTIVAEAKRPVWWLTAGSWLSLGIAFTMIVLGFVATRFGPPAQSRTWMRVSGSTIRMMAVAAIACVVTILIVVFRIDFPILVGTVSLFLSFVLVLALITSTLTATFDRFKLPVLTGLLLVAVVLSLSGINDNHVVEPVNRADKPAKVFGATGGVWKLFGGHPKIKDSVFIAWLKARQDLDYYKKKKQPYPVFIVAAAGGGLYAAAHTAAVLSKLQDRCPNFAQHVFAISGVSGGSLGAAAFAGLTRNPDDVKNGPKNGPWQPCTFGPINDAERVLEKKTRDFLTYDFLSPLVGAALFPDFLQRFLPVPFQSLGRARVLEESFERAWAHAVPEEKANTFKVLFADLWDPKGAAPALLLNTTDVDNGLRVVATPFGLQSLVSTLGGLEHWATIHTSLTNLYLHAGWLGLGLHRPKILCDLKLSTAVGLSARFPWVLPAATLERAVPFGFGSAFPEKSAQFIGCLSGVSRPFNVRLVDGGYFENSGAETAMDLLHRLSRSFVITKEEVDKCKRYTKASNNAPDIQEKAKVPISCQAFMEDKKVLEEAGAPMGVKIYLILIGVNTLPKSEPWYGGSEAFTPLLGLMNTRAQRGQLANFRANTFNVPCWSPFDGNRKLAECDPWGVRNLRLDPRHYLLPLGWHISSNTLDFIAFHSGRTEHGGVPGLPVWESAVDYRQHLNASDTAACAVQLILRGDTVANWKGADFSARPCAKEDASNSVPN